MIFLAVLTQYSSAMDRYTELLMPVVTLAKSCCVSGNILIRLEN